MPTTQEEAAHITQISLEYMSPEKLAQLYTRLDEEVGKHTDNDSLKQSLSMMRQLMNHVAAQHADPSFNEHVLRTDRISVTEPISESKLLWAAFLALVVAHLLLVLGVAVSFCVLPFTQPWYVALPLCTFIYFFSTNRVACPLTNLENDLRKKLGMKPIGGFVGHYFKRPVYRLLGLSKKRKVA